MHRHVWRPHDVVIWDNGRSMHRATADYGDARREMHRILLRQRARTAFGRSHAACQLALAADPQPHARAHSYS